MAEPTTTNWLHFYHPQPQSPPLSTPSATSYGGVTVADSTAVTTLPSPAPSGRVSKPIRRRSRASRRTPTTLLNTDAANFRAMVQQFTGGPTVPFANLPRGSPNFGSDWGPNPVSASGSGYGNFQGQFGNLMEHRQQQQLQQQQPLQYVFGGSYGGDSGTVFGSGFGSDLGSGSGGSPSSENKSSNFFF